MTKGEFVERFTADKARRKEIERKNELDYRMCKFDSAQRMRNAYRDGTLMKGFKRY